MTVDGLPLEIITPSAIAGVAVLMVLTGRLVPRRTYDDALHDRDEWRAAHRISETSRQEAADQITELLEHARTTDAFIRSLPKVRRST